MAKVDLAWGIVAAFVIVAILFSLVYIVIGIQYGDACFLYGNSWACVEERFNKCIKQVNTANKPIYDRWQCTLMAGVK